MLEAIDLTKRYEDGELALDGLTFKVEPGEIRDRLTARFCWAFFFCW